MRHVDGGISGSLAPSASIAWHELALQRPWQQVIEALDPGAFPRPAQLAALRDFHLLESRRNLVVCAPTNGGKSLVGVLALLDAVRRGRRAVLLEPLRAIAREKVEELDALAPQLAQALGCQLSVHISTGDYRLDDETFTSAPRRGEIVIATPERFDAILRNPDYQDWVSSVDAVCVDEAHLIGTRDRGPTLEYVLTSLLCMPAPPRLVLLSATMGNADRVRTWLSPCDVVTVKDRQPPLHKTVLAVDADESADDVVAALVGDVLSDAGTSALVFVYQTRSTGRLAALLAEHVGGPAGVDGVVAYHGQMSSVQRERARASFRSGRSRCLVTTTALGLGVNLPATHVIVRDTTFMGSGPVPASDLLQMVGRAGRGDQAGRAVVFVRPNEAWDPEELARALREETVPDLKSHFDADTDRFSRRPISSADDVPVVAKHVAAHLGRFPDTGMSIEALRAFFARSLGGVTLTARLEESLQWLTDPCRALAFRTESGQYQLTVLGLRATRSMLPLDLAAGFAQLLRDLLSLDPTDRLLSGWQPVDHLIVLNLLFQSAPGLRRFSEGLATQVDAWMERHPQHASLLYREWLAGSAGTSRAQEVLGSLGLHPTGKGRNADSWARQTAYLSVFRAAIMYDLSQGRPITDLEREWGITGLEGIEERWRDNFLWLLAGLPDLLDLRCFYFHLREGCDADVDRIHAVKQLMRRIRKQTFDLREQLKYCSPLGPALRSMRATWGTAPGVSVGIQTIRALEEAGVRSLEQLSLLQVDDLVAAGVRRDRAKRISAYMRQRMQ